MKKGIAGILAVMLCFGMSSCGSEGGAEEEIAQIEMCSHDWEMNETRPTCKFCGEERDGTTEEAVKYLWKDDAELGNDSEITMTNTDDMILLVLHYPQIKDNTMEHIVDFTMKVYDQEGYLPDSIKEGVDSFYELYLSDVAVTFMTDSYQYFEKYCGDNLKEFSGEIYYGDELMGRYVNGKETFNLFNDKLKNYGYHHK